MFTVYFIITRLYYNKTIIYYFKKFRHIYLVFLLLLFVLV